MVWGKWSPGFTDGMDDNGIVLMGESMMSWTIGWGNGKLAKPAWVFVLELETASGKGSDCKVNESSETE